MGLLIGVKEVTKIEEYEFIINSIFEKYFEYCSEWDKLCDFKINLNKKMICDIYSIEDGEIDKDFKRYVDSFNEVAEELEFDLLYIIGEHIEFSNEFKITSRIKTRESLIQKIIKKMSLEDGKFSIKKCINDLFGVRIIDANYTENREYIDKIIEELKLKKIKIKNIERNLETGYKAYHIYIMRDNNTFPIEIQVWDKVNEDRNIDLHSKHKEEYVKDIIEGYNKY